MLICGIKTTHDGGIALIEDGRLLFSIELEKLRNNDRYAAMNDLDEVTALLQSKGLRPEQVDVFAVDGWHGEDPDGKGASFITMDSGGEKIRLAVAGYNEEALADNNVLPLTFTDGLRISGHSYPYESYRHVLGHILGAYCTSPFSARSEKSYVLVWDGGQYPRLYFVDPAAGTITNKGPLFFLMGTVYGIMGQYFGPYRKTDAALEEDRRLMELNGYFGGLSIAGKIMSYIGMGEVDHQLLAALPDIYKASFEISNLLEHKFCAGIREFAKGLSCTDADVLLTIHTFLQGMLLDHLSRKIAQDGYQEPNLCFCGGSALNIKWNSAIRSSGMFRDVFVPPFPNDSGSAIGVACAAMWRHSGLRQLDWDLYCGPALRGREPSADEWTKESCSLADLARLLHETEEPVVFLSGCAEAGPRALGSRSILAVATKQKVKDCLNRIKKREPFRPVAPICLAEDAPAVFDPGREDPYMIFEHQVREAWKHKVPAICHLDGSARLQTVSAGSTNKDVRALLEAYKQLSGIPLLCNTSANHNGKGFFPDVESACSWGKTNYVWSGHCLYSRTNKEPMYAGEEMYEEIRL